MKDFLAIYSRKKVHFPVCVFYVRQLGQGHPSAGPKRIPDGQHLPIGMYVISPPK